MRLAFNQGLSYCRQHRIRYVPQRLAHHDPGPQVRLPEGARTLVTRYLSDRGLLMADTHQYLRGRQRLASGYEDPIRLRFEGEVVERWHADQQHCPQCDRWRQQAEASKDLL